MPSQAPEPAPSPDARPPEAEAWSDFCRRLEAVGAQLLTDEYATSNGDNGGNTGTDSRTELFAHLADQAVCWLGWEVFHADPRRPFFHRQNDLVTQWGGPNADNTYRHARVDPTRRYRIRGHMHSCEDFILAARGGFMHNPVWGTVQEVTASDRGIGRGDDFELLLGGDGSDPAWIELPASVQMVSIREYYFDWQVGEPATFTIECLDSDQPSPPVTGSELAARITRAAEQTEQSMRYWNQYQRDQAAQRVANSFAESQRVAKGLSVARYAFCFYTLGPDEALLIDSDLPDARYWSFQLYTRGGFESVDPADRITSLNNDQAEVGADGRVQVAVAHLDPGSPNWLDTGGRQDGQLIFRWFWPTGDGTPAPMATVLPFADLERLYRGAATAPDRAAMMAARRSHLAWRFRV